MIQPCAARAAARASAIAVADLGERPGDGDLVRHAEVGAPVDVEVLGRQRRGRRSRRRASPRSSSASGTRLAQPAAGGDVHRRRRSR